MIDLKSWLPSSLVDSLKGFAVTPGGDDKNVDPGKGGCCLVIFGFIVLMVSGGLPLLLGMIKK